MASVAEIVTRMVAAARASATKDWPSIRAYAKPEFEKLARSMISIGKLHADGQINQRQARAILRIHRNATETVFLTVQGMGILAAEKAINAALDSVKQVVNSTVGFVLL